MTTSAPGPAWLLVDYGETLSTAHAEAAMEQLAALAGQDVAEFRRRYWQARPEYDLGQPADVYWSRVLRCDPAKLHDLTDTLTNIDISGWLHMNAGALDTVVAHAHVTGARLALLSNAPHALPDAIDRSAWAHEFDRCFYSCRLGHAKPDPKTFTTVLQQLDADPTDVLFIDDRPENTRAAAELNMSTMTFTGAAALARTLGLLPVT